MVSLYITGALIKPVIQQSAKCPGVYSIHSAGFIVAGIPCCCCEVLISFACDLWVWNVRFTGTEILQGIFWGLMFGPGIYWGLDFCPYSITPVTWLPQYPSPTPRRCIRYNCCVAISFILSHLPTHWPASFLSYPFSHAVEIKKGSAIFIICH